MRLGLGLRLGDIILAVKAGVEAGSTLLQGLVSYWDLSEYWGDRHDLVGDNDLTPSPVYKMNGYYRGPVGTVAKAVGANSEFLSRDNYTLGAGDWTVAQWGYFYETDRTDGNAMLWVGKSYPYEVELSVGAGFYIAGALVSQSGAGGYTGNSNYYSWGLDYDGGPSWHFFVTTYNATTKHITTYIDARVEDGYNEAPLDGVVDGTKYSGSDSNIAVLGSLQRGYSSVSARSGPLAIYNRILSSEERLSLFNDGNGKKYSELTAADKVGLVNFWNLDEVSGVRYDSHGSAHLTDNNTVGSVSTGPLGTVATFVKASSESLTRASFPNTAAVGDASVSVWVKTPATPAYEYIFTKSDDALGGTPDCELYLYYNTDGKFYGGLGDAAAHEVIAGTQVVVGDSQWAHLVLTWDSTTKVAVIYLNGVANSPSGSFAYDVTTARTKLFLGSFPIANSIWWNGPMGPFGIWDKKLSQEEIDELFASGNGLKYTDLSDGVKTNLVSWYDLTEPSGVRYDSHGDNDLTDNNTVLSAINAGNAMNGGAQKCLFASNEYLSRAASTDWAFNPDTGTTISGWFKETDGAANRVIVSNDDGLTDRNWIVYYETDLVLYAWDANGDSHAVGTPASANNWHHLIVWYDPADSKAYMSVDGTVVSTTALTGGPASKSAKLYLGASSGGAYHMNGWLDEFAVWDRVLTADERAELFELGKGVFYDFA